MAGEDPEGGPDGGAAAGVVVHRDDAGKVHRIEAYSGASRRLDLDRLDFERVRARGASASS